MINTCARLIRLALFFKLKATFTSYWIVLAPDRKPYWIVIQSAGQSASLSVSQSVSQ